MKDPYQILGVPRDATADQVRRAYRARALRLHPDRAGGDAGRMAELNAAHDEIQAALARGELIPPGSRSGAPVARARAASAHRAAAVHRSASEADRARLLALAGALRDMDRILRTFPRRVERALERLEGDPYDLDEAGRFSELTAELAGKLATVTSKLGACDAPGELHARVGHVEQGLRQLEDAFESWGRYARFLDLDALVEGREILVAAMDWLDEVVPGTMAALEQALGQEVRG